MARLSIQFHNNDILNIDHAGYRYSRVDADEQRVEVSQDGIAWVQLYPQSIYLPECYDSDSGESYHEFDDHPTICSECGESIDRSHEIDFMEDSD